VLTSANQSYLIIGFKQPIKFNKNVIWYEQKQKIYRCHDFHTLECQSNFLQRIKNKQIWIATVNYQKIAQNFKLFEISHIVTG
jgi:hypothetical protein